jgi:hypothetical protein
MSHTPLSRRAFIGLGATVAGASLLVACTTVVRVPPAPTRVVVHDMPPPQTEVVTVSPGPGWYWVPGHWVWREGAWRWNGGHYVQTVVPPMPPVVQETITVAPSPAHVWVRGHWVWGSRGWVWARGTWVLR